MVIEQFCNFGIREPVMYIEPEVPTLKRFWLCQIYFVDKKESLSTILFTVHTQFVVCGLFFFVASKNLIIITISCEFKTLSEKYKAYKAIYYNVQTIDSIK